MVAVSGEYAPSQKVLPAHDRPEVSMIAKPTL